MLRSVAIGLLLLFSATLAAQNTYYMNNSLVRACKGIFKDSEKGKTKGFYDHSEFYIFTICVPGGNGITMKFKSFKTEKDLDYMMVYNGKDTFAGKISGPISGTLSPFTVKSTDSCITFVFRSDPNVAADGWEAEWSSKVVNLKAPTLTFVNKPKCKDNSLLVKFSSPVNCDSVKAANIKLTGPSAPAVTSVTPIGCNSKNESDQFRLNLGSAINQSGNFSLSITTYFKDICDSIWKLTSNANFTINDCPINVVLKADSDTICLGSCTNLRATITGGNPAAYTYTWNNSLTGAPPKKVCPTVNTQYILTVGDGVSAPGSDTVNIVVVNPPSAQNDTTVCQSSAPFNLRATPAGGRWYGTGITNSIAGRFHPDSAKAGNWKVWYKAGGCSDTVVVSVKAISGGPPNAACPGTAPFAVTWHSPAGGTWTGPKITSAGIFNPDTAGTYTVKYSWNGCTANKTIIVQAISAKPFDTTCSNNRSFKLTATPTGGYWTGKSVTNSISGIIDPFAAGAGIQRYIYNMNGCKDTTDVNILKIDARWDEIVCPYAASVTLPAGQPAGGIWKGKGITDSSAGIYNGSYILPKRNWDNDTLTYSVGRCSDQKIVYVRTTAINKDTMKYCIEDTAMLLTFSTVQNSPGGGTWKGTGYEIGKGGQPYFNPKKAGYGLHKLTYTIYGCSDSIQMLVRAPSVIQQDTTFCENNAAFNLYSKSKGGTWSGPGITNAALGTFLPSLAKRGLNTILYKSTFGCRDTVIVKVDTLPKIWFLSPDPSFCFRDTLVPLATNFTGGSFSGKGITGTPQRFNPKLAGSGLHTITYTYGPAHCANKTTTDIYVGDTLKLSISTTRDSICPQGSAAITAKASGGNPAAYRYRWSSGQNSDGIYVFPNTTTTYTVSLNDGCSDSSVLSKTIFVQPPPRISARTSTIKCYGEMGWAEIIPLDGDPYSVTWNTNPPATGLTISAPVGISRRATCVNQRTGCIADTTIMIPGHPKIDAFFQTIPDNRVCLNNINNELQLLNMCLGGTSGTWHFGDGSTEAFDPNVNPKHKYSPDTNRYKIRLVISNSGGCKDSFELFICMTDTVLVWVPGGFTPNKDGINDVFNPVPSAATWYELEIFNRWGQKIFFTEDMKIGWDGTVNGLPAPSDYYVYVLKFKGRKTQKQMVYGRVFLIR